MYEMKCSALDVFSLCSFIGKKTKKKPKNINHLYFAYQAKREKEGNVNSQTRRDKRGQESKRERVGKRECVSERVRKNQSSWDLNSHFKLQKAVVTPERGEVPTALSLHGPTSLKKHTCFLHLANHMITSTHILINRPALLGSIAGRILQPQAKSNKRIDFHIAYPSDLQYPHVGNNSAVTRWPSSIIFNSNHVSVMKQSSAPATIHLPSILKYNKHALSLCKGFCVGRCFQMITTLHFILYSLPVMSLS